MTQKFLVKMTALGYTEPEAQSQWEQAIAKAESNDPIYLTFAAMFPDETSALEEYAMDQIASLPAKNGPPSIDSDPLKSDSGGGSSLSSSESSKSQSSGEQNTKYTPPSIDDDQLRQRMNETVTALLSEKKTRTAATSIARVLVKTPDPSRFLMDNDKPKMVAISTAMDKITKFENSNTLEDTEENLQAYRNLKASAESKTPVPVYINDENNRRIIGVVINTIGADGKETEMTLSSKALEAFLLGQVSGIITNGQAYVKLANWKKKTRMVEGRPNTSITLTVQWTKKGYFWDKKMVDSVAAPMTQEQATEIGAPSPYERKTVKTAACFTVIEPNTNPRTKAKSPTRKRKIRLSGTCEEYPRFVIKPEYQQAGISIGSSNTYVSPNLTTAEAAKFDEQFSALVKGYMGGDRFSQIDDLAKIAPGAYERLTSLRQQARELATAGAPAGM